jgi:hypothetical protein
MGRSPVDQSYALPTIAVDSVGSESVVIDTSDDGQCDCQTDQHIIQAWRLVTSVTTSLETIIYRK